MTKSVYDLLPMKAPRAAGAALHALTRLAENPVTRAMLSKTLLEGAGVLGLRQVPADEPLEAMHPFLHVRGEAPTEPWAPSADALADAARPERFAAPGHAFETAADFAAAYRDGRLTPIDVAERVLAATAATEAHAPPLRIFIAQDAEDLRVQARASAQRWAEGRPLGPLDGVPVAVKDELDQTPYPTTVGTRFLGHTPAAADADVVRRLRAAGALLVGKTNMHEMGLGVTGLNPHHGAARNPYDPARATGGSSSGPAAAVAAGLCPIAVGADGGGSIRIPAALCGIVGLKATYGRISERGAAPLCWSVAHVGPMAATVADTALGYLLMAGADPGDPNTLHQPAPDLDRFDDGDLKGLRVGLFQPWFEDADPEIVAACRQAVAALEAAGATVHDVTVPELGLLRAVHLVTIVSEMAAAHLHHYAHKRSDYGLDTRLNLVLARSLGAYDYVHAQRHRARVYQHFMRVLADVDVIATPATACTAPLLPQDALTTGESNLAMTDRIMRFAPAGNLTGLPALSQPVGYDAAGLPIGLQLMGRPWDEALLLRLGRVVEQTVARRAPRVHHRLLG